MQVVGSLYFTRENSIFLKYRVSYGKTDDRVVRTSELSEASNETVASMIFYLIVVGRANAYTKICQITRAPGLLHEISTVERVEFFAYQKCFSIKRGLVEYTVMEKVQPPVKRVFSKLDAWEIKQSLWYLITFPVEINKIACDSGLVKYHFYLSIYLFIHLYTWMNPSVRIRTFKTTGDYLMQLYT